MASFPPREDMLTIGQISFFLILLVWVVLRNIPKKVLQSFKIQILTYVVVGKGFRMCSFSD